MCCTAVGWARNAATAWLFEFSSTTVPSGLPNASQEAAEAAQEAAARAQAARASGCAGAVASSRSKNVKRRQPCMPCACILTWRRPPRCGLMLYEGVCWGAPIRVLADLITQMSVWTLRQRGLHAGA